jgi:aspartyl-tRNA(Asn)/glutamyl-tRNA(Gln) amidotransferase subunit C
MTTSLSSEAIKNIAYLSRLHLSPYEIQEYQEKLGKILDAFEALTHINIPDMFEAEAETLTEESSCMRKDIAQDTISTQTLLNQAPEREGVFVRVPAILTPST